MMRFLRIGALCAVVCMALQASAMPIGYRLSRQARAAVRQAKPAALVVGEEVFGDLGDVSLDGNGNIVVTLTGDVSGTVEIPDNVGAVTIDLNGHDIVGDGGPAIRVVKGDGEGSATWLAIVDTSEGEKGHIAGGGESAGIEVAEGAATGVGLDVEEGIGVFNGDGSEQEIKTKRPGAGKVTVPKSWKVGQKVTWKAVADKGSVFAYWEGPLVDSLNLTKNERRNPSLAFVVPEGFDTNQVTAVFIMADDDDFHTLGITQTEFAPNETLSDIYMTDDSWSYVTASVKGLPSGLKFDAKTMRISGKATKPGVYKVTVSATNATVKKPVTATFEIVVPNLKSDALPNLMPETDAYGTISCGVAFDPGLVDCSPEDGWTVKVAGLPAGLKYDAKTGKITGVPTKAGTFTVTFTATRGKEKETATITLTTEALPDWAAGTFVGHVRRSRGDAPYHGAYGFATMTVAASGKISGKFTMEGTNWTFSAASYAAVDGEGFLVDAVAKAGKETMPVVLEVAACDGGRGATALPNGVAEGTFDYGEVKMWRNIWKDKATAAEAKATIAEFEGVYTVSMKAWDCNAGLAGYVTLPVGYLSLTVGKDGSVKAAGKLADGTSVSTMSPLMYDEEMGWFAMLYAAPSAYKGGAFAVAAGFDGHAGRVTLPGGPAQWTSRNPEATGEYGAGFECEVELAGAYYDKLDTLNNYYESLRVSLEGGAPSLAYTYKETVLGENGKKATASSVQTAHAVNTLGQPGLTATVNEKGAIVVAKATKPVQDKATKEWYYEGANDGALALSFTQATGIFKGSYTFWYDYESACDYTKPDGKRETYAHASKKVSFEGILVQGEEPKMNGFYLWDATSSYADPKTGKEKTYKYKESFHVMLLSE